MFRHYAARHRHPKRPSPVLYPSTESYLEACEQYDNARIEGRKWLPKKTSPLVGREVGAEVETQHD